METHNMKHVMLDLETLGTVADACIMSIGAVRFDLDSDEIDDNGFYASISIDSNLELKRRVQEDTLIWWMNQGDSAKGVFNEAKQTLKAALIDLDNTIFAGEELNVWSNGADFDLPMLAHAYVQCGLEVPWKYGARCFRTYKNLPGAKLIKLPFVGTKHNALFDAVHQAKTVQAIQKALFSGKHAFKVSA